MKDSKLHILTIDDHPEDYQSFRARYDLMHELSYKQKYIDGIAQAGNPKWDAILVDLNYGKGYEEGIEHVLPKVLQQVKGHCPVLVVTSDTRKETQQLVLEMGASGIVLKAEWYDELLMVRIREAIHAHKQKKIAHSHQSDRPPVSASNKNELSLTSDKTFAFISASAALQELKTQLETAINYPNAPILILGETGTGKEIAAKYFHQMKGNLEIPLEIINLNSLSKDLIASELFGHKKGAFTGAVSDKIGYLERAGNGVLFLDEIGEISTDIQVQLLRVLENRTFQRVGDTQERQLEAHVVFATNKNLEEAVEKGEIRADFYQRISALCFTIPPLRKRTEDILPLAEHFYNINLHPAHPLMGKSLIEAFAKEALDKFYDYSWPGNVRELRTTVQRLLFEAELKKKNQIDLSMLPDRFLKSTAPLNDQSDTPPTHTQGASQWDIDKFSAYAELGCIDKALITESGRKLEAAQRLGLKTDQHLRYKVKKHFEKYPDLFDDFQTVKKIYKLL